MAHSVVVVHEIFQLAEAVLYFGHLVVPEEIEVADVVRPLVQLFFMEFEFFLAMAAEVD